MKDELIFSPSEFVAVFNQTLEFAYPVVIIEGELCNFRISKNKWLYFSLQDVQATVDFFGSVFQLPGPLEDGLKVRVVGQPKLHPRYGFSINLLSITPAGEGSLKKAADLLAQKLEAEGMFAPQRRRILPPLPQKIGLITAAGSAAAADFVKILADRWGGLEILLHDAYVQGDQAASSLISAVDYFNRAAKIVDVLVITRGGGSTDDLAAFNDERVVRAIAASRIPTLVAIGHESDLSLAELAADQRASTPSNAAQLLVPDKKIIMAEFVSTRKALLKVLRGGLNQRSEKIIQSREYLSSQVFLLLKKRQDELAALKKIITIFDPKSALRRGYAIVSSAGRHISSAKHLAGGDSLNIELRDGKIAATVKGRL